MFMIITRSPLRITLGGGGTDLLSYYQKNEGFLISAAIDKYVYVAIHKNFIEEILSTGTIVFVVVILHNLLGYSLQHR